VPAGTSPSASSAQVGQELSSEPRPLGARLAQSRTDGVVEDVLADGDEVLVAFDDPRREATLEEIVRKG
jgi:hypothetical protein